jgi:hypothetical protein
LLVMAPNRRASTPRSISSVRSGSGLRLAAPDLPADVAGDVLGVEAQRVQHGPVASITSTPTPSPGIQPILYFAIARAS